MARDEAVRDTVLRWPVRIATSLPTEAPAIRASGEPERAIPYNKRSLKTESTHGRLAREQRQLVPVVVHTRDCGTQVGTPLHLAGRTSNGPHPSRSRVSRAALLPRNQIYPSAARQS